MEVLFKTVSQSTHPNVMVQYVLQKVKLATNDELGVEEMQMEYLKYMVTQIIRLMKNGSKIDVRDLVVHVYKVNSLSEYLAKFSIDKINFINLFLM